MKTCIEFRYLVIVWAINNDFAPVTFMKRKVKQDYLQLLPRYNIYIRKIVSK